MRLVNQRYYANARKDKRGSGQKGWGNAGPHISKLAMKKS